MKELSFDDLYGKVLLAGLTFYTEDGAFIEQKQLWGTVIRSDEHGITIKQPNGEQFRLPPDLSAFEAAAPGKYTLRSTGEVVENPDFLTTWTVTKPD